MLHVVRFVDRADRLRTREEFLAAHLAWLEEHRERVLVAGSLRRQAEASRLAGFGSWKLLAPPTLNRSFMATRFGRKGFGKASKYCFGQKPSPAVLCPYSMWPNLSLNRTARRRRFAPCWPPVTLVR